MESRHRQKFLSYTAKLDAMSPLKVLTRGYAMAQLPDGEVLRSVRQTNLDDTITVRVSDGTVSATVTEIKENA